jgi:hypothetical protein
LYAGEQLVIPEIAAAKASSCQDGLIYGVRHGETYFILADRFHVSVQALVEANPDANPNRLDIGKLICIPDVLAHVCPGGSLHRVEPGESLFDIALQHEVGVDTLAECNHWLPDPSRLFPGEQVCIPQCVR